MSVEQLAPYVEAVRAKNRERSKRYYDNQIKGYPGKYQKFLDKCKKKKTYCHSKDTNIMKKNLKDNKKKYLIYVVYIYIKYTFKYIKCLTLCTWKCR